MVISVKSEKEKAQNGKLYDANNDPELLSERDLCKKMCFEYNRLSPFRKEERAAILKKILGNTGEAFF